MTAYQDFERGNFIIQLRSLQDTVWDNSKKYYLQIKIIPGIIWETSRMPNPIVGNIHETPYNCKCFEAYFEGKGCKRLYGPKARARCR